MIIWTFLPQMTLGMRSVSGGKTSWITLYMLSHAVEYSEDHKHSCLDSGEELIWYRADQNNKQSKS
jgi:hypothetical protein